jgi:hypothetical protein
MKREILENNLKKMEASPFATNAADGKLYWQIVNEKSQRFCTGVLVLGFVLLVALAVFSL